MFNSFSAAVSAMKAHALAVDTVGNNLANVNTTGFKASGVAFKDLVSESMSARSESGMGVGQAMTVRSFAQGAIQSSSGKVDAAIQGNGFFTVKDEAGATLYTRDGGFQVDADGFLRTMTGEKVQQFKDGIVQDIRIPAGSASATPTSKVSISANLNAAAPIGSKFAAPIEVVDSLGARHTVSITYTKAADNQWDYEVTVPAADLKPASGGTAPGPIGTGTIDFNPDGTFKALTVSTPSGSGGGGGSSTPVTSAPFTITDFNNGAADLDLTWNLLDDSDAKPTLTQFAQASSINKTAQDGLASSELIDVGMVDGGTVMARFGNGQQKAVATLAISLVSNPDSLVGAGNNLFRATNETAQPVAGLSGIGGRGKVKAQALEGSTVDIAREFTNLIVYQRGYQANSRVITTADEMSQETLNMKR